MRARIITSSFLKGKKKGKKKEVIDLSSGKSPEEPDDKDSEPPNDESQTSSNVFLSAWQNSDEDGLVDFDKIPGGSEMSELDRLSVLNGPIEDRIRLLSSKLSLSVEETLQEISKNSRIPLLKEFNLAENPTKLIPLRLIHNYSCLPVEKKDGSSASRQEIVWMEEQPKYTAIEDKLTPSYDLQVVSNAGEFWKVCETVKGVALAVIPCPASEAELTVFFDRLKQLHSGAQLLLACEDSRASGHDSKEVAFARKAMESKQVADLVWKPYDWNAISLKFDELLKNSTADLPELLGRDRKDEIDLLTVWPPSRLMSKWVYAVSGRKPVWYLGYPERVTHSITENFGIGADSLDETDFDEEDEKEQQDDIEDQNAAIIRFVNEVIQRAIVDRATDIHFEPHKETLQIRYRIDGQLVPVRVPDNLRSFQDAIISRIKIMSAINISEKRRPQGGRITFTLGQSDLDIRVSTLPTLYGESISLRLLNEKSQPLSMRELGLLGNEEKRIVSVLEKPHGIVLVTGPTGSGKSTSLTAFIRKIHKPERRIMTVEDPVEYEVSGVNQTQVNSEIGFTFASALREILRQDPDVIMVGEIRDRETADIAIRASLTGHLVLSTLHTNDAPGAITRLIDMEIEPFLIASSVEMVIAQRLVRRLCGACAQSGMISEEEIRASLSLLGIDSKTKIEKEKVLQPVGCSKCQNLGFHGRVGIFELMRMTDEIHSLIIKSASAPEIREVALGQGMTTLQQSGWAQILRGLTSLSEVVRYADIFVEESEEGK